MIVFKLLKTKAFRPRLEKDIPSVLAYYAGTGLLALGLGFLAVLTLGSHLEVSLRLRNAWPSSYPCIS